MEKLKFSLGLYRYHQMPATAIPTTLKLADYIISTLLLTTVDPRETELIFMEKSKQGGSWTAVNAIALDLSKVPTPDLQEFDYERLRRQAASYGIVLAGVVADRDQERTQYILKGKGRVISPRTKGQADANKVQADKVQTSSQTQSASETSTPINKTTNSTFTSGATASSSTATSSTGAASLTASDTTASDSTASLGVKPKLPSFLVNAKITKMKEATKQDNATTSKESVFSSSDAKDANPEVATATNNQGVAKATTANASNDQLEKATSSTEETAALPNNQALPTSGATMIHYGNVRSGSMIYAQNKSLIIFGNVGDGAEVIADECVFIFGRALGRVLAGAKNKDSIVFCKHFNPQLVSINGVYCTADDLESTYVDKSILVRLKDGKLDYEVQN